MLALHVGLHVRTLERHFGRLFHTTPKAWITWERMRLAPPLLANGLSNKEVAAALNYTCRVKLLPRLQKMFWLSAARVRTRLEWCAASVAF